MTYDGGKQHEVGDRGQRFEVSYFDPQQNKRCVMGWSGTAEGARAMAIAIEHHPSWRYPQIKDREAKP